MRSLRLFSVCAVLTVTSPVYGDEALIAVATNFFAVAEQLEERFESVSNHQISLASGSTGKIYAQILNGAPYDAFLAADQERPQRLEEQGFGVSGTRFTYVVGRLVLASSAADKMHVDLKTTLQASRRGVIAMANPALAPYGKAAQQTLEALHLWAGNRSRIVFGENVGQATAMVATGNASIGFLARSMMHDASRFADWSYIAVPADLHDPILQDAVLLRQGKRNAAAIEFLAFLRSEAAGNVIAAAGYEIE